MRTSGLFLAALAVLSFPSSAQKAAATGAVTGHVTCADTNAPARLADVILRPVPPENDQESAAKDRTVEARRVQTMLDGTFYFPNVTPGTYFVLASLEGYISPLAVGGWTDEDLLGPTAESRKRLLASIPTVTVQDGTSSINLSLERSAAVSGRILYDDGSPAPGVRVQICEKKHGALVPVQNMLSTVVLVNSITNDRGDFRITGLPAVKDAVVEADLTLQNSTLNFSKHSSGMVGGPSFTFKFYSGDAVRPRDAKPFQLAAGEERPGEDISLPLSKLHNVQGVLVAKRDGHVLNNGAVTLLFADDHSLVGTAEIGPGDDNFSFAFVPAGDYILHVDAAADAHFEEIPNPPFSTPPSTIKTTVVHAYATTEMPLHVDRDLTEMTLEVPDRNSPPRNVGQQ